MDIDNPESLGDSSGSDSNSLGRNLLFEDVGENCDSDGVPIVQTHHPVLDGKVFVIPQHFSANFSLGTSCDKFGDDLVNGTPPPPPPDPDRNLPPPSDWSPYNDWIEFEVADLLFTHQQMSAKSLNKLFNIWEASTVPFNSHLPFTNSPNMYETIDSTPYSDVQWESFTIHYNLSKDPPSNEAPAVWKTAEYDGWFCDPWKLIQNIIVNHSFNKEFDYSPYQEYDFDGQHQFHDLFSGNWSWRMAVSK